MDTWRTQPCALVHVCLNAHATAQIDAYTHAVIQMHSLKHATTLILVKGYEAVGGKSCVSATPSKWVLGILHFGLFWECPTLVKQEREQGVVNMFLVVNTWCVRFQVVLVWLCFRCVQHGLG